MAKPLNENITGVYLLMLTPYKEDLTIDYDTYEEYCDFQVSQGTDHLFAVCGTSEMKNLTLDERLKLATLTAKHKGDTTVVATANLEATDEARFDEIERMSQTGVDGIVLTVRDMGLEQDKLVEHVAKMKEHTHLPVFMYEFPAFPNHNIDGDTYGRLVRECGIKGIKDTTCTMDGIKAKLAQKGDSCVIQANMPLLYKAYEEGSRGIMATPTSCGGSFFATFHNCFVSGDLDGAWKAFENIIMLDNCIDSGFNNSAKYLVQLQGLKNFRAINRTGSPLSEARMESIKTFHTWAVEQGLMK